MLNVVFGIAFVALAAVVTVWRAFQDGRAIADRPDRSPFVEDSRWARGGMIVGDFSGVSGGASRSPIGSGDGGGCGVGGGGHC